MCVLYYFCNMKAFMICIKCYNRFMRKRGRRHEPWLFIISFCFLRNWGWNCYFLCLFNILLFTMNLCRLVSLLNRIISCIVTTGKFSFQAIGSKCVKVKEEPGVVVRTCSPSIWEAEAGGS